MAKFRLHKDTPAEEKQANADMERMFQADEKERAGVSDVNLVGHRAIFMSEILEAEGSSQEVVSPMKAPGVLRVSPEGIIQNKRVRIAPEGVVLEILED